MPTAASRRQQVEQVDRYYCRRAYILNLRERGAARGTFKANYYAIQYLYRYTVSRDWALFAKKGPSAELRQLWKTHKNPRWLFPTRAAKIELSAMARVSGLARSTIYHGLSDPHQCGSAFSATTIKMYLGCQSDWGKPCSECFCSAVDMVYVRYRIYGTFAIRRKL
jgi:hypothetical protein